LLKVLKQILDTITFFRIQEGDKKFIEKEYQQKMKNAIWSAVPNLSVILAGGNPITMAIAAATQIGIGYMNYRRNKNQYLLEKEKQDWELQRSAIEQFNGLRRELFEAAWRLSDRYDFPDEYRLTEKQITQYNEILLDPDPLRRYERLDVVDRIFEAFPPYWYYKGNAAREIWNLYEGTNIEVAGKYKTKALLDYKKFDELYQEDMELMREDVIAASCFIEYIGLLNIKEDIKKTTDLLERAVHLAGDNFDVLQQCVFHYISLAMYNNSFYDNCVNILRRLVNENYNIALNGQMLSRIYCKILKNRAEYDVLSDRIGSENVIPWINDEEEAQNGFLDTNQLKICEQFSVFIAGFQDKYEIRINGLIPYDFLDPDVPDLIYSNEMIDRRKENIHEICADQGRRSDFVNRLDIVSRYIDLSNEMFDKLINSNLFDLIDNEGKTWKMFFNAFAGRMGNSISKIAEIEKKIKRIDLNDAGQTEKIFLELVDVSEFKTYSKEFFVEIEKEFENHLTQDCLREKQPMIYSALDKLFFDNGIILPNQIKAEPSDNMKALPDIFFPKPGSLTNKKEAQGENFPVFESNDTRKRQEIRIFLERKLRYLTKKQERIYFSKALDETGVIDKFRRQAEKIEKSGIPIERASIIAIVDTTLVNDLNWGIWFCYDGMYLRRAGHTDYIPFISIEKHQIKKPAEHWNSSVVFVHESGGEFTFRDTSINKIILNEIIDGIKDIIGEKNH
jgi:hypothetical protein